MNDLATLKSLTNIKPIATLGSAHPHNVAFNRFVFERMSEYGSVKNGIVLSINDDAHEDVEEWSEYIDVPTERVTVRRVVTDQDLQSLTLLASLARRRTMNCAMMLSDDAAVFRFVTARWQGREYPLKDLNTYFSQLRNAYLLSDEAGVMRVTLKLGSVNHTYTSREQMEEVLYPMAYYFFRDDTEL